MKDGFDPIAVGCAVALTVRYPWLGAAWPLPMLMGRYRSWEEIRFQRKQADIDPVVVGRVVQMALAGGLPLAAGLALAVDEVGQMVAAELTTTLRSARREGMSAATAASTGPLLRQLFGRIALAQASGAPMQEAVAGYLADARATRREKALEQARRLPVTLMVPLGLLILPGFVLLFVGPIVLNALMDLSGSLP
jgi:hypothetical protein